MVTLKKLDAELQGGLETTVCLKYVPYYFSSLCVFFTWHCTFVNKCKMKTGNHNLRSCYPGKWLLWVNRFINNGSKCSITNSPLSMFSSSVNLNTWPRCLTPQTRSALHCISSNDQATKFELLTQKTETAQTVQWLVHHQTMFLKRKQH